MQNSLIHTTIDHNEKTKLEIAEKIAEELLTILYPFFKKYEICGSIRRKKPYVGDIDLVAIPKSPINEFSTSLSDWIRKIDPLGSEEARELGKSAAKRFLNGEMIKRFNFKGVSVDLYLADESTFSTLVLIRTGSKEHNIKLTILAKKNGLKLFASGKGLCSVDNEGNIIEVISSDENEILDKLLGKTLSPKQRD